MSQCAKMEPLALKEAIQTYKVKTVKDFLGLGQLMGKTKKDMYK
jgi:hypothetical protein